MKIKLTIPTSLSDIKLSQYQKFLRTTKDSEDKRFIEKQIVAIFCDIPDKVVDKITKRDLNKVVASVTNVLNKNDKLPLQTIINHEGKEYGFIPSLEDITVGEQGDIDSMLSDEQKWQSVMKVLYREIETKHKDKYTIKEYTGKENDLDLTMDVVNGALVFFCDLLSDLLNCTQNFIAGELQNKSTQISGVNGDGIKTIMLSLEEVFSSLKRCLNYDYMKPYSF